MEQIIEKLKNAQVQFENLPAIKTISNKTYSKSKCISFNLLILIAIAFYYGNKHLLKHERCLVSMPDTISHAFRAPENCNFCRDVTHVKRLSNLSPEQFEQEFAYNARPVIITDATVNWTAMNVFNFQYFKNVYDAADYNADNSNCQFFPVS